MGQITTLNGTTSRSATTERVLHTSSTWSISLSLRVHTTKEWGHSCTQGKSQRVKPDSVGREMARTSVTIKIAWRRREVVSIILSPSNLSSSMKMMKSFSLIATHTLTATVVSIWIRYALKRARTKSGRQCFAKLWQAMIVKWWSSRTSIQGQKR